MRKLFIPIVLSGLGFAFFVSAAVFNAPLYKGLRHTEVTELQKLLKNPPVGGPDVYPEGLVTGYFGPLTEAAVQRFQAKYGIVSSGAPDATGYGRVGPLTRAKLNELAGVMPVAEAPQPAAEEPKPSEPPACRERKVPSEYASIQSAINSACEGDTILISAGEYQEVLIVDKEKIILKGSEGAENTVIMPLNATPIKITANTFTLDGITILGDFVQIGLEIKPAGAADITIQNSILKNNFHGVIIGADTGNVILKRNVISGSKFLGISDGLKNGITKIENNTMVNNDTGYSLDSVSGTHRLVNNIIVNNRTYGVSVSSSGVEREHEILSVSYGNVWSSKTESFFNIRRGVKFTPVGSGNLSTDPLFIPGTYQLRSTSLMIDAGDPNSPNDPDGSRADIGAYSSDKSQSRKGGSFIANLFRSIIGLFR